VTEGQQPWGVGGGGEGSKAYPESLIEHYGVCVGGGGEFAEFSQAATNFAQAHFKQRP